MKHEEKTLIDICNAYLHEQAIKLDESVDYSRLFSVAKVHNLIAIAFCVIKNASNKDIIPANIYTEFENSFYETIVRYDAQTKILADLDTLLEKHNIRHVFFKGAEIREYYPIPEARAMGDIDVLVDINNRDLVKKTLTENEYELINSNGPVYDYKKNGVLIEMHTSLVNGKVGNSNAEEYFSNAMEQAVFSDSYGKFDPDYHFAYMLTHIAHHFWFYGAGIKLILDLAIMQKQFEIDYDKVLNHMEAIGLQQFAKVILTVCNKWFGVGKNFDADTDVTEKFIAYFGAFGNAHRNKAAVVQRKELEEGKSNSPILTRIRLLFPSYKKIKDIPYIKFIEGKPWLLPLAWIYRIVYNFKHRKAFVKEATSTIGSDKTNTQAQKELKYFEEIGLL